MQLIIADETDRSPAAEAARTAMRHAYIERTFRRRTPPKDRIVYHLYVRYDPVRGPVLESLTQAIIPFGKRNPRGFADWSARGIYAKTDTVIPTDRVAALLPPALVQEIDQLYAAWRETVKTGGQKG